MLLDSNNPLYILMQRVLFLIFLLAVDDLYYDPRYQRDILDLLKFLKVKQDVDQNGSPLVTKFVRHFLNFVKNPIFLHSYLKLFAAPSFASPEGMIFENDLNITFYFSA
jgi:hypothetical protein